MEEKTFDRYSIWFGNVICFDKRNYHVKASRNVLFQMNGDNFIDIFYDSPNYVLLYANPENPKDLKTNFYERLCKEEQMRITKMKNICVSNYRAIGHLLDYFGFPKTMNYQDCMDMLNHLFNGKFAYENCEIFGYQKKPDLTWKNGLLVSMNLDPYDIDSYLKVNQTDVTSYFEMLNQIHYQDPLASFEPLKEEGLVRKRSL